MLSCGLCVCLFVVSWLICWRLRLVWFKLLALLWFVDCSLLVVLVYVLSIYFEVVFWWFWVCLLFIDCSWLRWWACYGVSGCLLLIVV